MKMRVSIARALASKPRILLMDEPFAALDEMSRDRLNDELLRLREEQKWTVLFVTHSVAEAVYLSDRIIVLAPHPGRVAHEIAVDLPSPRDADAAIELRDGRLHRHSLQGPSRSARAMKKHAITALNACIVLASLLLLWQLLVWALFHSEVHAAHAVGGRAHRGRALRLAAHFDLDHRRGCRRRTIGEHRGRGGDRVDLRPVAMDPPHVLPLYAAAANGADPGHRPADPHVDGARASFP